jgi:Dynamin central region/Dynamin GTPase effector domain
VTENISAARARENEAAFFEASPVFSKVDRKLLGVEQLTAKLTSVLVSRIYSALPSMRNEIIRKVDRTRIELDTVGVGAGNTPGEASLTLVRLVFEYHNLLQDSCSGRYVDARLWDARVRLCTRSQGLYDDFKAAITATRPDFDNAIVTQVEEEIRTSRGRELPGFLNPRIFESRVARFVEDWRSASTKLVSSLRKMMVEVTTELLFSLAPEFPVLRSRVREIAGTAIRALEDTGRKDVDAVFSRETQALTMNDSFLAAVNQKRLERFDAAVLVALARASRDSRHTASREKDVATLIRGWYQEHYCAGTDQRVRSDSEDMVVMLSVYWDVAAARFVDSHVMALEGSMIRPLPQSVHVPLNQMVLRAGSADAGGPGDIGESGDGRVESVAQLLREDEVVTTKRNTLRARLDRLNKARELVDKF